MTVSSLTAAHIPAVAEIERLCFGEPWSEAALSLLCGDTAFGAVALDGTGAVVAYGGMLTVLDEGQITNIATHPAHRRRGYAAALLWTMLDMARARGLTTVSLEVRESNTAAIALYGRYGFAVVGRRNNFYTAPREHALVMVCTLS